MDGDARVLLYFMASLLVLSFCVCSVACIYLCKDCCRNGLHAPRNQRQTDLEAPESSGTREGPHSGPSRVSAIATKSLKGAMAMLPNCKIVQYSSKRLFSIFGRSSKWKNETCAICLDEYLHGEYIAVCPCQHDYHVSCLEEWLRVKNDCPLCKRSVKRFVNERTALLYSVI